MLNNIGLESCQVIAKLDAKSSLVCFRGILNEADGIMLSRGNLGLDCLPEKIAVIQKNVTTSCNLLGKPCIVTRIVDTMVSAPRPTRAEATDVANAVLDGADCVMLGAETLRGMDPANAVRTVVACCYAAEAEFKHSAHFDHLMREAAKAEEQGIAVPGGEDATPDSSPHGSGAALAAMNSDAASRLAQSQSHVNLASSLRAMTRNAQGGVSHNSSLSASPCPARGAARRSHLDCGAQRNPHVQTCTARTRAPRARISPSSPSSRPSRRARCARQKRRPQSSSSSSRTRASPRRWWPSTGRACPF